MKLSFPIRRLPERPDLEQLKRQAKELLEAYLAGDESAVAEVKRFYHGADPATFALHDAQLVLARNYGYGSWPKLKAYVDGMTATQLMEAVRSGDMQQVRRILRIRPELVNFEEPGTHGQGALHYAVMDRKPEMVRTLMQLGANPNATVYPRYDATTPLIIAMERGYDEIASIIREEENKREAGRPATSEIPAVVHEALQSAVIHGDAEFLRLRHAEEDIVTPRDDRGWLLALAVDHDRPDILRLLLDFGLDPNARVLVSGEEEPAYTWGMPLYQCTRYGKYEPAELLLKYGADPNGQVYASGTPLSEAYGQRDDKMVALLERYGGESNPSMAGLYRRRDLARKLLEKYGDTPLPDDGFGKGPVAQQLLSAAARGGDAEIFCMALQHIDIPNGDPRWNGLLLAPLGFWNHWIGPWCHPEWERRGYFDIFKMVLERSGPPNAPLRNGATILHEIVTTGNHVTDNERVMFAAAALDAGARLDTRDDILKSTPLGWACRWGREELARLFLVRGADAIESDAEPWARPSAWAAKKGYDAISSILIGQAGI